MNYRAKIRCSVCDRDIFLPNGRLEWDPPLGLIQVCHHDCSNAYKNTSATLSDIELDGPITTPEYVHERLSSLVKDGVISESDYSSLVRDLFELKTDVVQRVE